MSHVWWTGEVHRRFCLGDLMETNHVEDLDVDRRIILKYVEVGWGCMD
jgi:hypothetical protein